MESIVQTIEEKTGLGVKTIAKIALGLAAGYTLQKIVLATFNGEDKRIKTINSLDRSKHNSDAEFAQVVGSVIPFALQEGNNYYTDGVGAEGLDATVPSASVKGGIVIDVGGHYGGFMLASISREVSHVYVFEPAAPNLKVLTAAAKAVDPEGKKITVIEQATGDHDGEISMTIFDDPALSMMNSYKEAHVEEVVTNIIDPDNMMELAKHKNSPKALKDLAKLPTFIQRAIHYLIDLKGKHKKKHTATVPIRRLSTALRQVFDKNEIALLKIDIEGAEMDCLNGIDDKDWPKIKQICAEVENCKPFEHLKPWVAKMKEKGYSNIQVEQNPQSGFYVVYASR
eukprot:m.38171 g.38171  ORF g.38171 m.38171 type:complete len:341 (-) comp9396_c0_seq1:45-1067(-)